MPGLKTLRWLALLAPALLPMTPAQAALVTYDLLGTVSSDLSGTPLSGTFSLGQGVSGSVILDTAIADSEGDSSLGLFSGSVVAFNITVGSYNASATGGDVETGNNFAGQDVFAAHTFINGGPFTGSASVTGASVGGLDLGGIIIELRDNSQSALANDSIPNPIVLSGFDEPFGRLEFYDPNDDSITSVGFTLSSMDANSTGVTEPSMLLIFGFGMLAWMARPLRLRP